MSNPPTPPPVAKLPPRGRRPRLALLALAAYWSLLFVASHVPLPPPGPTPSHRDKVAHLVAYAGLAFLLAICRHSNGRLSLAGSGAILAIGGAYGVVDELLQIPVPGRSADPLDWLADVFGLVAGLLLFRLVSRQVAFWFGPVGDDDTHRPAPNSNAP